MAKMSTMAKMSMMPAMQKRIIDIDYALYCASWLNDYELVVGGGGGTTKSGMKNRISICSTAHEHSESYLDQAISLSDRETAQSNRSLKKLSSGLIADIELSRRFDAVMAIESLGNDQFLAAMNSDSSSGNTATLNLYQRKLRIMTKDGTNSQTNVRANGQTSIQANDYIDAQTEGHVDSITGHNSDLAHIRIEPLTGLDLAKLASPDEYVRACRALGDGSHAVVALTNGQLFIISYLDHSLSLIGNPIKLENDQIFDLDVFTVSNIIDASNRTSKSRITCSSIGNTTDSNISNGIDNSVGSNTASSNNSHCTAATATTVVIAGEKTLYKVQIDKRKPQVIARIDSGATFRAVRFVNGNRIIAAANQQKGKRTATLYVFQSKDSVTSLWSCIKIKALPAELRAVTSVDIRQGVVVVGCANGEIVFLDALSLRTVMRRPAHSFPVTACRLSNDARSVASISVDGKIVVQPVPDLSLDEWATALLTIIALIIAFILYPLLRLD